MTEIDAAALNTELAGRLLPGPAFRFWLRLGRRFRTRQISTPPDLRRLSEGARGGREV